MDAYALRTLRRQPLRTALTIGGIALCVVLMLFLLAIYRGAADGSVEYIRRSPVDLWILQRNATNILRGSSIVSTPQAAAIARIPGVRKVGPVLFLLSTITIGNEARTMFLTGFEPALGLGGPPRLIRGRNVRAGDEIVLDRSFAARCRFRVKDRIRIQGHELTVVGISTGTNAFVIQYAFTTLQFAQELIGIPNLATCFLVQAIDQRQLGVIRRRIRRLFPALEIYDQPTFLANNLREMKTGFLPLLYTVAAIGAVVLTVILSLLLSVNILERRKDFAVLKILGGSSGFLARLVILQALAITSASCLAALALFFPLLRLIETISPEVSARSSPQQIVVVTLAVMALSLFSSLISIQRLRHIYLLEVFQ